MKDIVQMSTDETNQNATKLSESPRPEQTVFVIGDIHGCADKLEDLLTKLEAELEKSVGDPALIFVGDYIDRGLENEAVLRFLQAISDSMPELATCLAGNHEHMLLNFLDAPEEAGPQWLRNGGANTLESFGLTLEGEVDKYDADALTALAKALHEAMGDDLVAWLRALPLSWSSGNLWITHAGADPSLPMDKQDAHTLLWGSKAFFEYRRRDDIWVAYGHYPMREGTIINGRICVDTGAVYGRALTAARIDPDGFVRFISA